MRCINCTYPLTGLAAHRCPECGTAFDPDNPATYVPDQPVPRRRLAIAASFLGICVASLGLLGLDVITTLRNSSLGMLPSDKSWLLPMLIILAAWLLLLVPLLLTSLVSWLRRPLRAAALVGLYATVAVPVFARFVQQRRFHDELHEWLRLLASWQLHVLL